jgi:hypothetical protein
LSQFLPPVARWTSLPEAFMQALVEQGRGTGEAESSLPSRMLRSGGSLALQSCATQFHRHGYSPQQRPYIFGYELVLCYRVNYN